MPTKLQEINHETLNFTDLPWNNPTRAVVGVRVSGRGFIKFIALWISRRDWERIRERIERTKQIMDNIDKFHK